MLNGSVPEKLQTFGKDSFLGNLLCGKPLNPCPKEGGVNSGTGGANSGNGNSSVVDGNQGFVKNKKKGKLSGGAIAGIVIGSVVILLFLVFALILLCRNRNGEKTSSIDDVAATLKHNQNGEEIHGENIGNGYSSAAAAIAAPAAVNGDRSGESVVIGGGDKKLVFFRNWGKVFDLEDLLRASAEVLGKGTFGTSYKAVLEVGPVVVAVKRLRDVTISEREFKEKIERVGAMVHENLAPLRAYYYSRDEKLLVHDYLHMGSLSALLHGEGFTLLSFLIVCVIYLF
jgi:F0F1-type ATP synthase membrane subunit c/vacuolar-type H+-ATPase subunit K